MNEGRREDRGQESRLLPPGFAQAQFSWGHINRIPAGVPGQPPTPTFRPLDVAPGAPRLSNARGQLVAGGCKP